MVLRGNKFIVFFYFLISFELSIALRFELRSFCLIDAENKVPGMVMGADGASLFLEAAAAGAMALDTSGTRSLGLRGVRGVRRPLLLRARTGASLEGGSG